MAKVNMADGGQAFPRPGFGFAYSDGSTEHEASQDGMSLRDWFAGMVLQGLLQYNEQTVEPEDGWIKGNARIAYEYADAMIVERDKGK